MVLYGNNSSSRSYFPPSGIKAKTYCALRSVIESTPITAREKPDSYYSCEVVSHTVEGEYLRCASKCAFFNILLQANQIRSLFLFPATGVGKTD